MRSAYRHLTSTCPSPLLGHQLLHPLLSDAFELRIVLWGSIP